MTSGTRTRVETKSPVDKLQFYVDRDIVLKRTLTSGETKIVSGIVKIEQGKQVNIILIKKNTAGICTKYTNNTLDISFEEGPDKVLTFGVAQNAT